MIAAITAAVVAAVGSAQGLYAWVGPAPARVVKATADAQADFRRRVYEAQVKRALEEGRRRYLGLGANQLGVVEGEFRLRKDAAERCRLLLERAKSDLKREKERGNPEALRVSSFGVYSAYRSVEHDEAAWRGAFNKHLRKTKDVRTRLRGGEYGDAALEMMVIIMRRYKAAPGFSKHTGGTAVDFMTVEDGVRLTANSDQQAPWKRTWLHKWLVQNADRFSFNPLHTEAWHWDYRK
jgi:hypothetical protein